MLAALYVSLNLAASAAPPVCVAPSAASGTCRPRSEGEILELLAPYLGTIDRPNAAEDWRRLPPEALPILERIAADRAAFATQRALALDGAAAMGSDGQIHRRLAADPSAPIVVRHAALRAIPSTLPPGEAQRVLAGLMDSDPDPRIRGAAATVIARTFSAEGCAGVRVQWKREAAVGRAALQRALTACEGR